MVLSRVRLTRVRLVLVNLNPINDTYNINRSSTCLPTCVASAAWFVLTFVFVTTFLFSVFFSCEFDTSLWCSCYMYDPAHMSVLLFHLYIYYFNPCVCVSTHVCAPASSSIFVHIYSHCHMYCLCHVFYLYPCFCVPSSFPET